jgi:hypothetical protein
MEVREMADLNVILNLLILVLVALWGYVLMATKAAVKTSAEEAAKAAIRELQWPLELARELQKTRGVERQELRFKSYGALWKELRPLAIYDETVINKKTVGELSAKLSDWYFSECGGLLLTPQAREFYFALQDLLRATSRVPGEWSATRSKEPEGAHYRTFRMALEARDSNEAISVLNYFSEGKFEDWQEKASDLGKKWRKGIIDLAAAWDKLDEGQRFASLQQVGSKLRTSLVTDLESRLL